MKTLWLCTIPPTVVLLLSVSCTTSRVAPKPPPPVATQAEQVKSPAPRTSTRASWGAMVGEPRLDNWIEAAVQDAPALAVMDAIRQGRAADTRKAGAALQPLVQADLTLREGRKKTFESGFETVDTSPWLAGGRVEWELDPTGAKRTGRRAAEEIETQAEADQAQQSLDWAVALSSLYVQGCAQVEQVRLMAEQASASGRVRDWTRRRRQAGLIPDAEVDAREAEWAAINGQLQSARNRLAQSAAHWQYLTDTNQTPGAAEAWSAAPATVSSKLPPPPPEETLPLSIMGRPDIEAAYAAWQAADYSAAAAHRDRLPSLAVVGTALGEGPSPIETPDQWVAWAGLRLTLPLWEPKRDADKTRGQAQARASAARYREQVRLALMDMQQAYARRIHTEEQWQESLHEAHYRQQMFTSQQNRYDAGLNLLPELEQARRAMLQASNKAQLLRAEALRAQVDVGRAMGGAIHKEAHTLVRASHPRIRPD